MTRQLMLLLFACFQLVPTSSAIPAPQGPSPPPSLQHTLGEERRSRRGTCFWATAEGEQQQGCYSPSSGAGARPWPGSRAIRWRPGHKRAFHWHQSALGHVHGCSEERYRWLGGSTSLLQHTLMYSLTVTMLPALVHPLPVTLSIPPLSALPYSQSPTLLLSASLPKTWPSPAIASSVSTTLPSPVLHSPPAL